MTRVISSFLSCLAIVIVAGPASADEPVKVEDAIVAETEDFQIFCFAKKRCPASDVPREQQRAAQRGLEELQQARAWLDGMGFDVAHAKMDSGTDGKKALRLQFDSPKYERRCDSLAIACRLLSLSDKGRIILPIENVYRLADGETLVHEYVHTLQPARRDGNAKWLNEMVATAIGSAWVRKRTGASKVYEPKYSMVLDREFHDGEDDPGYGKWDYAIALGNKIGSQDGVAYLAQDEFINAANDPVNRNGNSMSLFYDDSLVKTATFETFFPEYVVRFNNVETGGAQKDRAGKYFYYGDIDGRGQSVYLVDIPDIHTPFQTRFAGEAAPFSAHPVLLSLKLPSAGNSASADNIFLAEVEVIEAPHPDNLTVVREHRLAVEKRRDVILIDGNDPPEELGFFRVVNTPPADASANETFKLQVSTHPVSFKAPRCFQADEQSRMVTTGLDEGTENWRLKVNNGTAEGLVITPASAGKITVQLEIDSPITRGASGIAPKAPRRTEINLGTYDVVSEGCVETLAGNLVASFDGKLNDYFYSFGLTSDASVHWKVVMDVKTKSPRPNIDPYGNVEEDVMVYPDDGSTFQLSGRFEFRSCDRNDGPCNFWTNEEYSGGGAVAVGDGDMNIFSHDGDVWLEATLPVTMKIIDHRGELKTTERSFRTRWQFGCASSGKWWTLPGHDQAHAGTFFHLEPPLNGRWVSEERNEIEFFCSEQWDGEATSTGSYSGSMELLGRVEVQSDE
jgi:hypothetical protein